ncbi:response regulator receiver domain [Exiguobacterium sp. s39]|uniref:response regulator receiver domain n=1 Tax=Exiguobacterium sp. s39 TaxID=2751198 RepID=UPI001BE56517|nr:response regulator receiver domain [Exiguobacterium sp. s39]
MSEQQVVQKIVKEYFNSAVIIDDNLELVTNKIDNQDTLTDNDLGIGSSDEIFWEQSEEDDSIESDKQNEENLNTPFETYQEFIKEGFVIMPWKYNDKNDIGVLKNTLNNSKLLIVDWNLEPSSYDNSTMGEIAIEIINNFISSKKGLKCAVIYTQEDTQSVQAKLQSTFACKKIEGFEEEDLFIFEEKDSEPSKSLFGIIMTKNTKPENIIKNIAQILLESKSITIHLMESANALNANLGKSMTNFNAPFEKVLFSQMITSNLSNNKVSQFINETLVSSVIENDNTIFESEKRNFLFETKKMNIVKKLNIFEKDLDNHTKTDNHKKSLEELVELLNLISKLNTQVIKLFKNYNFIKDLVNNLENSNSVECFKNKLSDMLKKHLPEDVVKGKYFDRIKGDTLFLILFLDDYNAQEKEKFIESFKQQSLNFTKILKFISLGDKKIKTGSVIKNLKDDSYLLCITPLCDTERPASINNKYKFLIGDKIDKPSRDDLKNNKNGCYFMPLPLDEELIYIKWNFFDTCTIELSDLDEKESLLTLKKDYIQNIMNRYIAYQSRAGINEIFYKESNYISNFMKLMENE